MEKKRWKTAAVSLLTVLLLSALVFFVFRNDYREILDHLRRIPAAGLLALMGLAFAYQAMDALICRTLLRKRLPELTFLQALEVTLLGVFGNVSTSAVGSIPMQSCYLQKHGLMAGRGIGVMTLEYVLHKTTVLLYATVLLLAQWDWFQSASGPLSGYLVLGYAVCALVIAALLLACTWKRVLSLALMGIGLLPEKGKWTRRRQVWSDHLRSLYDEAQALLKNRARCAKALALNAFKLFCLYSSAYLSLRLVGVSSLSLWRVQLLSALMMLIINALPNVAGVGPAEFAFILIFSPYAGGAAASSALILYRAATYFFPFLASVLVFLRVERRMVSAMQSP